MRALTHTHIPIDISSGTDFVDKAMFCSIQQKLADIYIMRAKRQVLHVCLDTAEGVLELW